jgi:hypothetical protein
VVAGRLIVGAGLDMAPPHRVAFVATCASVLGCVQLIAAKPSAGILALAAVALVGLQQGSEGDIFAYFVGRYCGVRAFSSVIGVLYASLGVSVALGVIAFGALYEATGAYELALQVSIGAFLLAAAALAMLGRFTPLIEARPDAPSAQ